MELAANKGKGTRKVAYVPN